MNKRPKIRSLPMLLALVLLAWPAQAWQESQEPTMQEQPAIEEQPVMSAEATALLEAAIAGDLEEGPALKFRPYYFPSQQGGTLTMIGFEIGKAQLMFGADAGAATEGAAAMMAPTEVASLELFAAILQDGAEIARLGTPFTVAATSGTEERTGIHSLGDVLGAGAYELVWGVRDTVSGSATTRRDAIEVPSFAGGELTTSSVLMVAGQGRPAAGMFQPHTVYEGVRVLTVSFPDALERTFAADTPEIMLTYIVVGAQPNPSTQALQLELEYRILNAEGESLWRTAPQGLDRPTVGQPIPLQQIENLEAGGEYTFEIGIKDLVGGTETTRTVSFTIAG